MSVYLGMGLGGRALAAHPSHQHAHILPHAAQCLGPPWPGTSLCSPAYDLCQHPNLVPWLELPVFPSSVIPCAGISVGWEHTRRRGVWP